MPVDAAVSKLAAVRAFGATVHQQGASVDECVALARERAEETGLTFVHPFDDHDVIAGQAGLGIELAEAVPDLRRWSSRSAAAGSRPGSALAVQAARPEVAVVGVQAAACAPVAASLAAGRAGRRPRRGDDRRRDRGQAAGRDDAAAGRASWSTRS